MKISVHGWRRYKKDSGEWLSTWCGLNYYQVKNAHCSICSMDLGRKTCSFMKCDLTGIPCAHAISCIWNERKQPKEYVSKWYTKDVYLATYVNLIYHIWDKEDWPSSGNPPLAKPNYHKAMPWRPKRLHRLEPHEVVTHNGTKLSWKHNIPFCSNCGGIGHNVRTCDKRKQDELNKVMILVCGIWHFYLLSIYCYMIYVSDHDVCLTLLGQKRKWGYQVTA